MVSAEERDNHYSKMNFNVLAEDIMPRKLY